MRKITLLFALLAIFCSNHIYAQTWIEDVYLSDDFGTTGGTTSGNWVDGTLTQGFWSGATQSTTNTFTSAINTTTKNVEIKTNVKIGNFVNCVKTFTGTNTPYTSPSGKVTVSFICKIGAAQTYSGAYFYFRDNTNKPIFGLGFARINSGGNKWLAVGPIAYTEWVTGATAAYANITSPALLPTAVDAPALKVTAVLDFSTHKYSLTAMAGTYTANGSPEWTDGTNIYSQTGLAFLDNSAANVSNIIFEANGNQTSSSATATNFTFDNFKIAGEKISSGTHDVTINYIDQNGNPITERSGGSSRTETSKQINDVYSVSATDKVSFSSSSYYYAYDAANTASNAIHGGTGDSIIVKSDNYTINLRFKKTEFTTGTYTWTGLSNGNLNEIAENFTTTGSNSISFQNGNALEFPESATNKTITLNGALNLGTNNAVFSGNGYTFSGTGSLTGTGKLIVNPGAGNSTSLNFTNNLSGGVNVQTGTAVINSTSSGSSYSVGNTTTLNLNTGEAFSKAISGTTGTNITIIPTTNTTYSSTITNIDTLTYVLPNSGTVSTSAFSGLPTLNNVYGGKIKVQTSLASTYFASTLNLPKVSLGDNVYLVYPVNPATGGTTITIDELTGTSLSKLMGNRIARAMNYNIGGANTNFTFDGKIENFPADAWAGMPIINLSKVGTGTMVLNGRSTGFNTGSITVTAGKLVINDSIGATTVPTTVATGATLSGSGTIIGSTTVNGTLEGSLKFGSSLTLAGTTNITVNGFGATQYDSITVAGGLTNGGNLNITVSGPAPALGSTIKLIKAGTITGTFANVSVPSNYLYNQSTGVLYYGTYTNVSNTKAESLQVYPTMTTGVININGQDASKAEIFSIAGQTVKQVNNLSATNSVNISDLSNGAYLIKVQFADGSAKTQRILLQK